MVQVILPVAQSTSGSREGQQVPKDAPPQEQGSCQPRLCPRVPEQGRATAGAQEANSEDMESWSNKELVPCSRLQAQFCSPNMIEEKTEHPWLSLNGLQAHGNGCSTGWGCSRR